MATEGQGGGRDPAGVLLGFELLLDADARRRHRRSRAEASEWDELAIAEALARGLAETWASPWLAGLLESLVTRCRAAEASVSVQAETVAS